jgi:hypothetical protein
MKNKFKLILYTEINSRLYHVEEMDEYSNSAATLIKEAHHIIRDIKELGIMEGFTIEIWKNDSKGMYGNSGKPYWSKKVKASGIKENLEGNKRKFRIVEIDKKRPTPYEKFGRWEPKNDYFPKVGDTVSGLPNEKYSTPIKKIEPPYFYYQNSEWEMMNHLLRGKLSNLEFEDFDGIWCHWKIKGEIK